MDETQSSFRNSSQSKANPFNPFTESAPSRTAFLSRLVEQDSLLKSKGGAQSRLKGQAEGSKHQVRTHTQSNVETKLSPSSWRTAQLSAKLKACDVGYSVKLRAVCLVGGLATSFSVWFQVSHDCFFVRSLFAPSFRVTFPQVPLFGDFNFADGERGGVKEKVLGQSAKSSRRRVIEAEHGRREGSLGAPKKLRSKAQRRV